MPFRSLTSFEAFRTIALQVLAVLSSVRAVLIVTVYPLSAPWATWVIWMSAAALLVIFVASVLRREVSEPTAVAILWLALVGAVVGGLTMPEEVSSISNFTVISLSVVAAGVLGLRQTVIFTLAEIVTGTVSIALTSTVPIVACIVFVGMTIAMTVVVAMLRQFLRRERDHAFGLALTDALTGALNRRGLAQGLPALLDLAYRTDQQVGCLVIDVDHFKAVNDRFGHEHGDRVLVGVVAAIESSARRSDLFARLGGEEFVLIALVPGAEELRVLAEKVRVTVAERGLHPTVTVSVGGSINRGSGQSVGDGGVEPVLAAMISAADAAMYTAKEAGRNRVVIPASRSA